MKAYLIPLVLLPLTCQTAVSTGGSSTSSKSAHSLTDWKTAVENRGEMLHWNSLEDYLKSRGQQKKYLVVGCGHNAFYFNKNKNDISRLFAHKYDTLSSNHYFSHSDAFTIMPKEFMPWDISPDINGYFPKNLPDTAKGMFDEIYLENINGGTKTLYKAAYEYLKPGGELIDDRYGSDTVHLGTGSTSLHYDKDNNDNKFLALEALVEAGFSDISFQDKVENSRNGRTGEKLVIAKKTAVVDNNPVLKEIENCVKELKEKNKFDNLTLNDLLKGYYRNVPSMFNYLYFKYRTPPKNLEL